MASTISAAAPIANSGQTFSQERNGRRKDPVPLRAAWRAAALEREIEELRHTTCNSSRRGSQNPAPTTDDDPAVGAWPQRPVSTHHD